MQLINHRQQGIILLVSLVLLLILTIISLSVLRSSLVGVKTTEALQRGMLLHHEVQGVLLSTVDDLADLNTTNLAGLQTRVASWGIANTVDLTNTVTESGTAVSVTVVVYESYRAPVNNGPRSPYIERSLCDGKLKNNDISKNTTCMNIILTATGRSPAGNNRLIVDQMAGFGMVPPSPF